MQKSTPSEVFPERLRGARELRELTQEALAARSGLQPSAISHFESGTRKPSFDNLRRLADALRVSTDYLLGRTKEISGAATSDRCTGILTECPRKTGTWPKKFSAFSKREINSARNRGNAWSLMKLPRRKR